MFHRILLAWDGSRPARHALDVAVDLARRYDADIVAVSVAYSPRMPRPGGSGRVDRRRARAPRADARPTSATAPTGSACRSSTSCIEGDHPAEDILEYAHQHGFDLVVAGRHRTGRAGRLLLHELAERLARQGTLPVLILGETEGE